MNQHTPGPWKILGGCIFAHCKEGFVQVGTVYQRDEHGQSINGDAVDYANAMLKAAAPELLAACQALADPRLAAVIATTGLGERLHSAIAKATAAGGVT